MKWWLLIVACVVLCCACEREVPAVGGGATSRTIDGDSVGVPADSVGGGVAISIANDGEWDGIIEQ